jgi:hypothetical protein
LLCWTTAALWSVPPLLSLGRFVFLSLFNTSQGCAAKIVNTGLHVQVSAASVLLDCFPEQELSHCSAQATDWTSEESEFNSKQEHEIFVYLTAFRPALGPT